ncbi:hypothetical protein ACFQE1_06170 [Halobium palmae]|uniref:Uncharacterized protein n=1 Tax=Halobium palmae TaxID=1776492 RepID=A0ABD5RY68_9EURY
MRIQINSIRDPPWGCVRGQRLSIDDPVWWIALLGEKVLSECGDAFMSDFHVSSNEARIVDPIVFLSFGDRDGVNAIAKEEWVRLVVVDTDGTLFSLYVTPATFVVKNVVVWNSKHGCYTVS